MHKTIAVLLGSICLFPVVAHAEQPATTIAEADNIKTLFFGHDDRVRVTDPTQSPWDAIGQLETASGNLYSNAHLTSSGPDCRTLFIDPTQRQTR